MKKSNGLTLKLDGTTPGQLSMAKLVKYMSALVDLYGSADSVHFDCVSEGSADLNAWVDNDICYNAVGNDSNLLIVFYVQIMPDDFVMQLHRF